MASNIAESADSWNPAPYGKACAGCSRAKSKCFYQALGTQCERCIRLGKNCEPAVTTRKRKARGRLSGSQQEGSFSQQHSALEAELDDIAHLLRQQAQSQPSSNDQSHNQVLENPSTGRTLFEYDHTSAGAPEVVIDADNSMVQLVRPSEGDSDEKSISPILQDIAVHHVTERDAEKHLAVFRRAFLPLLPFVHLPVTMKAAELRREKPFLWLVIMALATTSVSEQFSMEATIWKIISQRVVVGQAVSVGLLLGIIGFASWSHYFKQDKPFMTMLTQLAVAMAFELNLHKEDRPELRLNPNKDTRDPFTQTRPKALEERRTIVALFHLTSITWAAYRKTEPMRLSPYIEECINNLMNGSESHLDALLGFQTRCQILVNTLTVPNPNGESERYLSQNTSAILHAAMLRQVSDLEKNLPFSLQGNAAINRYLCSTELSIRDYFLSKARPREQTDGVNFARLQELDLTLNCIERWFASWSSTMQLADWVGINVDIFAQFTHSLAVLFKLTTLNEPGWDVNEVKRRADVLAVLDFYHDKLVGVPEATGMVDAPGPRSGLFFKVGYLFKAIRALFAKGLHQAPSGIGSPDESTNAGLNQPTQSDGSTTTTFVDDDFLMSLADEPWLSEAFVSSWEFGID